jgi:hypothetical protein
MKRSSYEREWGKRFDEPTVWDKILGFLLRIIPPIGPLQDLRLKLPTPQVEKLFMDSFSRASIQYGEKLDLVKAGKLSLPNENYDVGTVTPVGQYFLDDDIQAYWLHKLAEKKFTTVTPEIKAELTGYFGTLKTPLKMQQNMVAWKQLQADYAALETGWN